MNFERGALPRPHDGSRAEAQSIHRQMEHGDMVGTVLFLLSDESGFISGQNLSIDGGLNLGC